MFKKLPSKWLRIFYTVFIILITAIKANAQCGIDVYVANDNSGSVDAKEDMQARAFISKLGKSFTKLGNANTESRVAVSSWAQTNTWSGYTFPGAGRNYTTLQSDLTAYEKAPRVLSGGTDPVQALQKTFADINRTPVAGRTVPKVIVLMTDARCDQIPAGIKTTASKIKAAGIYIMVLAIGSAANEAPNCPIITGTNVASPGMYFSSASYQALTNSSTTIINSMITALCTQTATKYDLTIALTAANCTTGAVTYTVSNVGNGAFSNQTVYVSFYNGDPALPTTKLITSTTHASQTIAAGASVSLTSTNAALIGKTSIWAVVNINPSVGTATPPLPLDLNTGTRLQLTAEGRGSNNKSAAFAPTACTPNVPVLEVSKTLSSLTCDKKAVYTVNVCNTGNATASNVVVTDYPSSSLLTFLSSNSSDATYTAPSNATAAYAHPGGDNATTGSDAANNSSAFASNATTLNVISTGTLLGGTTKTDFAGFRFTPTTGIPQGATILSATLNLYATSISGLNSTGLVDISGEKSISSAIFANTTNTATGKPSVRAPLTTASVAGATTVINTTNNYNVKTLVQEMVNQATWALASSPLTFIVTATPPTTFTLGTSVNQITYVTNEGATPAQRPTLTVTYFSPGGGSIAAGKCITFTYVLDASLAPAATYQNSVGVTSSTPATVYAPNNTAFTANGVPGLKGYDGATNTGDELVLPASTGCSQTLQPITTSVSITPTSICGGTSSGFVKATITITNPNTQPAPNGVGKISLIEELNLTGGATFAGEPNNFTTTGGNGVLMTILEADELDPLYPTGTPNTLSGKTSIQNINVLTLPPGTHTFDIDINPGSSNFGLSSTLKNIPSTFNSTGSSNTATDNVTVNPVPTVSITSGCTSPLPASTSTISVASAGTNIATQTWSSSSAGVFSAPLAASATYTINNKDRANGYVDFNVEALSAAGCDASATCRVVLTASVYDYGDLPTTYDFSELTNPVAAAALVNGTPVVYLGSTTPDSEGTTTATANADGDGVDEDGIVSLPTIQDGITSYSITVKAFNNSGAAVNLYGWIDWNNDGVFTLTEASSVVAVPTSATAANFTLTWTGLTGVTCANSNFLRLRIGTDLTAYDYTGVSEDGEIEDYKILQPDYGNLPATWPTANASTVATNQAWLGINAPTTECATSVSDPTDGLVITDAISGAGTSASPWVLAGNNAYNFAVTVNGSGTAKPVFYGIWYDVNGDGDFIDAEDIFLTGNANHGSPVTVNLSSGTILGSGSANGATSGKIRVIASAIDPTYTKANSLTTGANGSFVNGEVEDYYVQYLIPLPVNIQKFTAIENNCRALLNWQSAEEINFDHFEVEFSSNGSDFNKVAYLKAKGNHSSYEFAFDQNIGKSHYRLKLVDVNGSYTYSEIKTVNITCINKSVMVFPNPTVSMLNVNISGYSGLINARLQNSNGQLINTFKLNNGSNSINTSNLPSGLYFLNITDELGNVEKRKINILH